MQVGLRVNGFSSIALQYVVATLSVCNALHCKLYCSAVVQSRDVYSSPKRCHVDAVLVFATIQYSAV